MTFLRLAPLFMVASSYCPPSGMLGCLESCRVVSLSPSATDLFRNCSENCFEHCDTPQNRRRLQPQPLQGQCLSSQVVSNSEELNGVNARLDALEAQDCCNGGGGGNGGGVVGLPGRWPAVQVFVNPAKQVVASMTAMRQFCFSQSPQMDLVSIKTPEHVIWLREQVIAAGVDVARDAGTPLGIDYELTNEYFDLTDPTRSVQYIFDELRSNYGWSNGDHHTDQTAGKGDQYFAGIGWQQDGLGVEDWSYNHDFASIVCEEKRSPYPELIISHNADYAYAAQSLAEMEAQCKADHGSDFNVVSLRDEGHAMFVLSKLLEAGVPVEQAKGVPLGQDPDLNNQYSDLTDNSRSVQEIFDNLRQYYGWTGGDHHTDQTSAKQIYAGIGWYGGGATDYGIEDWGANQHTNSAVACERGNGGDGGNGGGSVWPAVQVFVNPAKQAVASITAMRQFCFSQSPQMDLVSIKTPDHVIWLREQVIAAGVDVALGEGTPLGMDYELTNEYFDLTDPTRSVQYIFDDLRNNYGWSNGDHHTDQTAGVVGQTIVQYFAGIGWQQDGLGIEDWSYGHVFASIICEKKRNPYPELIISHNADYAYDFQSLAEMRAQCKADNGSDFDVVSLRDEGHAMFVLSKLLEAGVPVEQGKGVPLGQDSDLNNQYSDLRDDSRSVQEIFDNLKQYYGWTGGDHHTDQTSAKQIYAGIGWFTGGATDYGIEDWALAHTNSAVACERV